MIIKPLAAEEIALYELAKERVLHVYDPRRHSVASAVLSQNGSIYQGVNIDTCGYGPCAEPIAIGAGITANDKKFKCIVAVGYNGKELKVLSPCGNCRQMMIDFTPGIWIILSDEHGQLGKIKIDDLMPYAYQTDFDKEWLS